MTVESPDLNGIKIVVCTVDTALYRSFFLLQQFGLFDFVFIDEAGRVGIAIGLTLFLLGMRIALFGDVHQIQPYAASELAVFQVLGYPSPSLPFSCSIPIFTEIIFSRSYKIHTAP